MSELTWRQIALQPFTDPDTGHKVSPDDDPEAFIVGLHRHLKGDCLFATAPHNDGEWDLDVGATIALDGSSAVDSHLAAH